MSQVETTLELLFKTSDHKRKTVRFKRPKENLTEVEVKPALSAIQSVKIFKGLEGVDPYAEVLGAQYVKREVVGIYSKATAE